MKSRDYRGRYKADNRWRYVVLALLAINFIVGYLLIKVGETPELYNPYVSSFFIRAVAPTPTPEPKNDIESLVYKYFGNDSQDAIKIMKCESGRDPNKIGDEHLFVFDVINQEKVGDSIGLFQIRTGGNGWNRARANGMTADEFRVWLKKPENNIKYAKDIFDRRGWFAWYNCMNKVL